MNHQLLVAEYLATPWALMPERLNAVTAVIARWSGDARASDEVMRNIAADKNARDARRQSSVSNSGGGIAVLPLYGIVTQRGNMVDDVSGPGTASTQQFSNMLRAALQDETVSQILIDIDSPGGSVYGVAELADEIVSARAKKPVVAIANSLAASAAYWIGCSIGVWQAHQDYSKAMDEAGVKTTLISAGKFKVEGNPYAPLDEEAQGFMQSRVDDYYAAFTKAVAKGRGVSISQVRDGMGQGRVLGADAALASSMVDGIATFEDVVKKMRRDARTQIKPNASRLNQARNSLALM
jgi:signal peptide peptidase SppA